MNAYLKYILLSFVVFGAIAFGLASLFPDNVLVIYVGAICITTFLITGYDKSIAHTTTSRVPELLFFALAILGGSLGLIAAMGVFRHKTKKASFQVVAVIIFVAQLALLKAFSSEALLF